MQWPLSAESGQCLLTRDSEVQDDLVLRDFRVPEHAMDYLSFMSGDHCSMAALRSAATECLTDRVRLMTNHQVIEAIAWELTTGNLQLAERVLPVHAASAIQEAEESEGDDWPAPVPEIPRPPKPERPAEFGPQARTLIEAAQTGVPFCEECAAAAAAQKAA